MRFDKPNLLLALFVMGTASAATGSETLPEPIPHGSSGGILSLSLF